MHNVVSRRIDVEVVEDDTETERAWWAIRMAEKIFQFEAGKLSLSQIEDTPNVRLRLTMTKRTLRSNGEDFGSDAPIPFKVGQSAFDFDGLEPDAQRHQIFCNLVQSGRAGRAVCQGPPGTGKTTLLAKLTCALFLELDLGG